MERFIQWLKRVLRVLLNVDAEDTNAEGSKGRPSDGATYERAGSLLNASERKLFHDLVRAVPDTFFVLAKVRMEDVIRPTPDLPKNVHYGARSRVKSRHFDFIIIDDTGDPLLAIELDGPHHGKASSRAGDSFKTAACEMAMLRLVRFTPGMRTDQITAAVREAILPPS